MTYVFLIDCDGMTIDSEVIAMGVMADHIISKRPDAVRADIMNMFGTGGKDILNTYGLHTPTIDAELHHLTVKALSRACEPTQGMIDFLTTTDALIKEGIIRQKAIVTSSAIDRVVGGMVVSGVMEFFHKTPILSAESSISPPRNKPDPAIYNHAIHAVLKVTPQEITVAFEDSISGVKAAKAANVDIIFGCMHGLHMACDGTKERVAHAEKLREAGATHVVNELREIWPILGLAPVSPRLSVERSFVPAGPQRA